MYPLNRRRTPRLPKQPRQLLQVSLPHRVVVHHAETPTDVVEDTGIGGPGDLNALGCVLPPVYPNEGVVESRSTSSPGSKQRSIDVQEQ